MLFCARLPSFYFRLSHHKEDLLFHSKWKDQDFKATSMNPRCWMCFFPLLLFNFHKSCNPISVLAQDLKHSCNSSPFSVRSCLDVNLRLVRRGPLRLSLLQARRTIGTSKDAFICLSDLICPTPAIALIM